MRLKSYKFTRLAQEHLHKIKTYTLTNFSEIQWQHYKTSLMTGLQMLADNPDVGLNCDDIFAGGFYFPIAKHTAYYTKHQDFILIVAVLSQSQLPENHLK